MTAIETAGLTKSYGERPAVADLDLRVERGSVYGFIGPNGAGKTTTIRMLLGFLRPNRGVVRVLGRDATTESHVIKRDVGYVPGDLRLHTWMCGRDALLIHGRARGLDLRAAGDELAAFFELDLSVVVREMSRGMRQKLGLILALAHDPALMILDEPTTALDPITQARLYQQLRERAAGGATVFFSSHVLSEVEGLCDAVAIVRAGRLVADETVATLRRSAGRAVTIRWKAEPGGAEPPPCLHIEARAGDTWRGELRGPVSELLAWLSGRAVDDLVIAAPDLDRLFLRYYLDREAEG